MAILPPTNVGWQSPISNTNKMCGTFFLFTLEKSIYVKWDVLWVNMVESENFQ